MAEETAPGAPPAPVSFGFTRTAPRKKLSGAEVGEQAEGKEWVRGVEGRQVVSVNPVEAPKELVIPLIQKNRWNKDEHPPRARTEKGEQEKGPEDGVLSQAVKELIEESKRSQEIWEHGEKVDLNMTIPLLMQNKVPDGFEDGDKVDVSLRPESATDVDYDVVPVEAYGMAMLRGMGWKQGEGIGRTFKQDVKPLEHQLRPKGLGLGADRSAVKDLEPSRPRRPPKPGEERQEEVGGLVTGALVHIETGAHKELYGKVEGVDPDNARVMVKLAIGGKVATVTQYSLRLVGKKEYEKNSKDLSRLSKAHKAEEKRKEEERKGSGPGLQTDRTDLSSSVKGDKKRKPQRESDRESPAVKQVKNSDHVSYSSARSNHWLQRDLRVRFIDKQYKGGRYYNAKIRIEDVLSPEVCVCRTEEGCILDGIKESMLETLIPKMEEDFVMVVLGPHRGQVGRILRRDKEKSRALVQLLRDEVNVLKLDFDAICHYVGETQE
ncbi:hypothetical protein NDU88_000205 [Pleurodeles waltl]|uniref:G-patch domain and KOW motifs-containing protein n=1 Tax=Pleurodeles waltl TaxID=8319 RepID=A0AAV7LVS0_PLEWA|nr:hypothetical protein NDU88_000205 [Pleurodeles waltl]